MRDEQYAVLVVRAPVRISFAGGGTDLPEYYTRYGGMVLSAAIARYAYVLATPSPDGGIHIHSADYQTWHSVPAGRRVTVGEPLSLPRAAVEAFQRRGMLRDGVSLLLASEAPPGTGLGSSSAMAVALVRALSELDGETYGQSEVAALACRLEIERLGMPIGKQDQYASAYGGLNLLRFGPDGVEVERVRLPGATMKELGKRLMLCHTGTSRHSSGVLTEQRAATGADERVTESLHRLKALASEMHDALLRGDLDGSGRLLDTGWQQKRRLAPNVSNTEIDSWYDAALEAGAVGGKLTGAGGGGFLLLYVPPARRAAVSARMRTLGLRELTFRFDYEGVCRMGATPKELDWIPAYTGEARDSLGYE